MIDNEQEKKKKELIDDVDKFLEKDLGFSLNKASTTPTPTTAPTPAPTPTSVPTPQQPTVTNQSVDELIKSVDEFMNKELYGVAPSQQQPTTLEPERTQFQSELANARYMAMTGITPPENRYEVKKYYGLPIPTGRYVTPEGKVGYDPLSGLITAAGTASFDAFTFYVPRLAAELYGRATHKDLFTYEPETKAEQIVSGLSSITGNIASPLFPFLAKGMSAVADAIIPEATLKSIYGQGKFFNRAAAAAVAWGKKTFADGLTLGTLFALQTPLGKSLSEDMSNRLKNFVHGAEVASIYNIIGLLSPELATFLFAKPKARTLSFITPLKTPLLFNVAKAGAAAAADMLLYGVEDRDLVDVIYSAGIAAYFGYNTKFVPQTVLARALKAQIDEELRRIEEEEGKPEDELRDWVKRVIDDINQSPMPSPEWQETMEKIRKAKNPLARLEALKSFVESAKEGQRIPLTELQAIKRVINAAYGDINRWRQTNEEKPKEMPEGFFYDQLEKRLNESILLINHYESPETVPYPEKDDLGRIKDPKVGTIAWIKRGLRNGRLLKTPEGVVIEKYPDPFIDNQTNFERYVKTTKVGQYIGDTPKEKELYWTEERFSNEMGSPQPDDVTLLTDFKMRVARLAPKIAEAHNKNNGATFSLYKGDRAGEDAYAISIFPERSLVIKDRPITKEDIIDFVNRNADLFSNPFYNVRTWRKAGTSNYLDVVVVVKDRAKALEYGRRAKQEAIFYLKDLVEIKVDGTSDAPLGKIQDRAYSPGEPDITGYYFSDKFNTPYAWISPQNVGKDGYSIFKEGNPKKPLNKGQLPFITIHTPDTTVDMEQHYGHTLYEVKLNKNDLYIWDGKSPLPTPEEIVFNYDKVGVYIPEKGIQLYTPVRATRVTASFKPADYVKGIPYRTQDIIDKVPALREEKPLSSADEVRDILNSFPIEHQLRIMLDGHLFRCPDCGKITIDDNPQVKCSNCGKDLTDIAVAQRRLLSDIKAGDLKEFVKTFTNAYNFDDPSFMEQFLKDMGLLTTPEDITKSLNLKLLEEHPNGIQVFINDKGELLISGLRPESDTPLEKVIDNLPENATIAIQGSIAEGKVTKLTVGELKKLMKAKDIKAWTTALTPSIHFFEQYLPEPLKRLYYKARQASDFMAKVVQTKVNEFNKLCKELKITKEDSHNLALLAYWQQEDLRPTLKEVYGITKPPELSENAKRLYEYVQKELSGFWFDKTNEARAILGVEPLSRDNPFYFPAIREYVENPEYAEIFSEKNPLKVSNFLRSVFDPFNIERVPNKQPLKLDFVNTYKIYMNRHGRWIATAPLKAEGKLFLSPIRFTVGNNLFAWSMAENLPIINKELMHWINYVSVGEVPSLLKYIENKPRIAKIMSYIMKSVSSSILSFNARSAVIQPAALRNAMKDLTTKDFLRALRDMGRSPSRAKEIMKFIKENSEHIASRSMDVMFEWLKEDFERNTVSQKIGDFWKKFILWQNKITQAGIYPLKLLDLYTSELTWYAAYLKGQRLGYTGQKLINYADDVVVRTQASANPEDISKIQRIAEGRFLTIFQTFTINEWQIMKQMLFSPIMKIKRNEPVTFDDFVQAGRFLFWTTMWNYFYEDIMHMRSPFPTPIREFRRKYAETEDIFLAAAKAIRELGEQVPIFGATLKYGTPYKIPLPAAVQTLIDVGTATNRLLGTRKFSELRLEDYSAFAKLAGITGAAQAEKMIRRINNGMSWWQAFLGIKIEDTNADEETRSLLQEFLGLGGGY